MSDPTASLSLAARSVRPTTHVRTGLTGGFLLLLASACSPRAAQAEPSHAPPQIAAHSAWSRVTVPGRETLPELPTELQSFTAELAVVERAPVAPEGSMNQLNTWLEQVLAPRLKEQAQQVEKLQQRLARNDSAPAKAASAGLLGHVHESLASELLLLPTPHDMADDAELVSIFRRSLLDKAQPNLERAKGYYATCAQQAHELGAELSAWETYCRARVSVLQAQAKQATKPVQAQQGPGLPNDTPSGTWAPPASSGPAK